jgi:lipopolysaccharide assembly outer membrane protein LptD (OstA)
MQCTLMRRILGTGVILMLGVTVLCAWAEGEPGSERVEVNAVRLDYNKETGWVTANGNVVVRRGTTVLRADSVRVNMNTEVAYARGNVHVTGGDGKELHTERLDYNFRTGEAVGVGLSGQAKPFILVEGDVTVTAKNEYELHKATVTTCTNEYPHCHYTVYAKRIQVVPDESIKAWGATYYFGSIPIFYLPYWHRELHESSGLRVEPGYDSRMGGYLLNSYRYRLNATLRGETHLDYRTRRGLAAGQDFSWERSGVYHGGVSFYYADDDEPLAAGEDPAIKDITADRYRVRLQHSHSYNAKGSLLVEANYLSDTDILEDFFEDEYRSSSQPENYAVYAYREDSYVAHVAVRPRLNDFYAHVDRLPEVSIDLSRQQIGDSRFYYEGQTAAANLSRLWPEGSTSEDYSTIRVDSEHTVLYPAKVFRFLTLTPRVGVRATYYGATVDLQETVQTNQTQQSTNATSTNVSAVVQNSVETGSAMRTLFEVGLEVSFKAYKTWQGGIVSPLRHVIEPYANYTFVPEPSTLPENLYQFDTVDALGAQHDVWLGVRNKFQSKRDGQSYDLLDVDVRTRYELDPTATEESFNGIFVDMELRPTDWLAIDLDTEIATTDDTADAYNARIMVQEPDEWSLSVDYRFREDTSATLGLDLSLFPVSNWAYNLYGRHEFEAGRTEEVGGYIQRNLDCMSIRLGTRHRPSYERLDGFVVESEWRASLEVWFTAFPEVGLHAGRHRN